MSKTFMRTEAGEVFETQNPEYHRDSENLGGGKIGETARKDYVRKVLRKMLKPGQTVYANLRSVSSSGMSRTISFYIVYPAKNGQPAGIRCIDNLVSDMTSYRYSRNGDGLNVSGCGMDMGFAAVYALGAAVWPKGTPKPHGTRNGAPDNAGGYALKHEWI